MRLTSVPHPPKGRGYFDGTSSPTALNPLSRVLPRVRPGWKWQDLRAAFCLRRPQLLLQSDPRQPSDIDMVLGSQSNWGLWDHVMWGSVMPFHNILPASREDTMGQEVAMRIQHGLGWRTQQSCNPRFSPKSSLEQMESWFRMMFSPPAPNNSRNVTKGSSWGDADKPCEHKTTESSFVYECLFFIVLFCLPV